MSELELVIELMKVDYPSMISYTISLTDDELVLILGKDDIIIAVITNDQLTEYWNEIEGFVSITIKGDIK